MLVGLYFMPGMLATCAEALVGMSLKSTRLFVVNAKNEEPIGCGMSVWGKSRVPYS